MRASEVHLGDALFRPQGRVADPVITSLARGDREAIRDLYRQHHAHVRAFARRLVGDDATAEDLVHEVFVSLPAAIRNYRGDGALRSFLLSIAVNHARHHVRAAARRRAMESRFVREPAREASRPDEAAQASQLADALVRALDELPLEQRVAFVLCEVEERTSVEAAEIAGANEGTVRARVMLAKRRLREALEKEGFR